MKNLRLADSRQIKKMIKTRAGETKVGQHIGLLEAGGDLKEHPARFVLLGVPEDIGVRANFGRGGTSKMWEEFLQAFLNMQDNEFLNARSILLLGEIDTATEMRKAGDLDLSDPNYHEKLADLVKDIDDKVSAVVREIISAEKLAIVIGGGHNNAFGNLKGCSDALGQQLNVLNIDAHTDLRWPGKRHSGNGFSTALEKGYLKRYAAYGLQRNYTPQYILDTYRTNPDVRLHFMDQPLQQKLEDSFQEYLEFVSGDPFGLELDCDAICGFPSSAGSPSGLDLNLIRKLVLLVSQKQNCRYLHLAEAIPSPDFLTGKALALLVSDFVNSSYETKR